MLRRRALGRSSARAASGCRTSPSPTISVAAVAQPRTSTLSAVDDEHALAIADCLKQPERAWAGAVEDDCSHHLPGHEPHAQVELLARSRRSSR
jgi:hypothetical protein